MYSERMLIAAVIIITVSTGRPGVPQVLHDVVQLRCLARSKARVLLMSREIIADGVRDHTFEHLIYERYLHCVSSCYP